MLVYTPMAAESAKMRAASRNDAAVILVSLLPLAGGSDQCPIGPFMWRLPPSAGLATAPSCQSKSDNINCVGRINQHSGLPSPCSSPVYTVPGTDSGRGKWGTMVSVTDLKFIKFSVCTILNPTRSQIS